MDKDVSPPSNTGTITELLSSPSASHNSIPPPPPSSSPDNTAHFDYLLKNQNFGTDFASLYRSIFPPKSTSISLSPSTCCSSASINDDLNYDTIATQQRLNQARLILQYQELNSHYDLCCSRLLDLIAEADLLRQENAHLRIVNTELLELLSSHASFHNLLLSSTGPDHSFLHEFRRLSTEDEDSTSTTSTNRFDRPSSERFSLPKSISVRSTGFMTKASNLPAATHNSTPTRSFTRPRVPNHLASGSQKVYLSGKRVEDQEAMELEVYNQGMLKTELCNKWQETGTCPYGDQCQFAHGITELRPVIRHPRYKTEVCRMVVAGGMCPYGHRCHFRHSLSEQEKLLLAPR